MQHPGIPVIGDCSVYCILCINIHITYFRTNDGVSELTEIRNCIFDNFTYFTAYSGKFSIFSCRVCIKSAYIRRNVDYKPLSLHITIVGVTWLFSLTSPAFNCCCRASSADVSESSISLCRRTEHIMTQKIIQYVQ